MVTPSASPPSDQRRLARPGRSPVSLQRQTNARLARHRLKIKQQRLDQLAALALMEREQLARERRREQISRARQAGHSMLDSTATAGGSNHGSRLPMAQSTTTPRNNHDGDNDYLRIDIEEILTEPESSQSGDNASIQNGFLRGLFVRLSARSNASSVDSNRTDRRGQRAPQDPSEAALIGFDVVDGAGGANQQRRHPQQQQIAQLGPSQTTNGNSTALEICDNHQEGSRSTRDHQSRRSNRSGRTINSATTNSAGLQRHHSHRQPAVGSNSVSSQQHQTSPGRTIPPLPPSTDQMASTKRHLAAFKFSQGSSSLLPDASSPGSSTNSSTLSLNKPFCKICHLSSNRNGSDKLISPCKCSGTMQYVHCGCLLKWLEISNRTSEKPISCELCSHEYTWHKRFNYNHIKLPRCSVKDMVLHLIFVLSLAGMMFCALAPLFHGMGSAPSLDTQVTVGAVMMPDAVARQSLPMGLSRQSIQVDSAKSSGVDHHQSNRQQNRNSHDYNSVQKPPSSRKQQNGVATFSFPTAVSPSSSIPINDGSKLAKDEKFVLACAALFFVSFFIAIYAQTKTRDTLYGLIVKFTNMNLTYFITEYDHGAANQTTCPSSASETNNNNNNVAAVVASDRHETEQSCSNTDDYRCDQMTDYSHTVDHGVTSTTTSRDHHDASPHVYTNANGTKQLHT